MPLNKTAPLILEAKHIILASGSSPIDLSCAPIDNEFIIDSTMALNLGTVPKRLAIIGAGVIGLELTSIWKQTRRGKPFCWKRRSHF